MRHSSPPLDRSILTAFKSAHDAGRLDVAEHLLSALECLCNETDGSAVDEAYRIICRGCGCWNKGRKRQTSG
jgi:hypothetical protein